MYSASHYHLKTSNSTAGINRWRRKPRGYLKFSLLEHGAN